MDLTILVLHARHTDNRIVIAQSQRRDHCSFSPIGDDQLGLFRCLCGVGMHCSPLLPIGVGSTLVLLYSCTLVPLYPCSILVYTSSSISSKYIIIHQETVMDHRTDSAKRGPTEEATSNVISIWSSDMGGYIRRWEYSLWYYVAVNAIVSIPTIVHYYHDINRRVFRWRRMAEKSQRGTGVYLLPERPFVPLDPSPLTPPGGDSKWAVGL